MKNVYLNALAFSICFGGFWYVITADVWITLGFFGLFLIGALSVAADIDTIESKQK